MLALTQRCDNLIDWTRVGNLLTSGHRYSGRELAVRGTMILTISCLTWATWYGSWWISPQPVPRTIITGLGLLIHFTIVHYIAIRPLIKKRERYRRECRGLAEEILAIDSQAGPEIEAIMETTAAGSRAANSSQTWGQRRRLLRELLARISVD